MNLKTLASAVDVNSLKDNAHKSGLDGFIFFVETGLIAVGVGIFLIAIAFGTIFKEEVTTPPTLKQVIAFVGSGALLVISGGIAFAFSETQNPNVDAVIVKSFAAEYPDLTLYAEDISCIKLMIDNLGSNTPETCSVIRKVDGGFAKVKFFIYRDKFAIAGPSGKEITSDADISVPADGTLK